MVGRSTGNKQVDKNAAKEKVQILTSTRKRQREGIIQEEDKQEEKANDNSKYNNNACNFDRCNRRIEEGFAQLI